MAVQTPQSTGGSVAYQGYEEPDRGYGWVAFAGVLMLIVGTINFIEGIAAIGNAHFFVHNTHYVVASLNTWGWVALCIGVVQVLVGLGVFAKNQFARWAGVFILSLNMITALMMMPAYPLWSLVIFTVDVLAIYGLVAYGHRITD
jgi:C4-dicarboxylate transporter